jgi:DNA primase
MTGLIAEQTIEEIRTRADIVEVVARYVTLKHSGRNHLGLCPFHSEKTPSFNVNAERQIFHCFGCGAGGDVFAFLMRMEGLAFPEAVRRLAEQVGVEVGDTILSAEEEQRRAEREQLRRITEVACQFYQQQLLEAPAGAAGRQYLRQRGFDGDLARQFRLGWAPDSWDALARHLHDKGFEAPPARERLGLLRAGQEGRSDYDLFRRRLLFPILDERGRPVAFGGRVLDDSLPKYINSPESPIYHKSRVLYGLYQAREAMRRSGEAIVVEGYFDQLALYRAGFHNAVATCGTALTTEQAHLLKRFASRVLMLFDQDAAGQKATFRAMDVLLAEGLGAAVVALEPGDDPDSFLRRHSAADLQARLDAARPVLEVYMDTVLTAHGPAIEGRARAAEEILGKLRLLTSDIERDLYLRALAQRTGLDEALLRGKTAAPVRKVEAPPRAAPSLPPPGPAVRRTEGALVKAQRYLLRLLLADARLRGELSAGDVTELFSDMDFQVVAARILAAPEQLEARAAASLCEGLNDQQKGLLSGILVEDENQFAEDPEAMFHACRATVLRERRKLRFKELAELVRDAYRRGDTTEMAQWQREMNELSRSIKG